MRKIKFTFLTTFGLLSAFSCFSQEYNWGVGLRVGDPMGITVKKYLTDNRALELNVGRAFYWWGHESRFKVCDDPTFADCKFWGYPRSSFALGIQGHYLFQKDIVELKGLQWYYGFGGQLRFNRYEYQYKLEGNKTWFYATKPEFDIGGDAVIGLEYIFPNAPIAVFADVSVFVEVFDNLFLFWPQGGFWGRYNF